MLLLFRCAKTVSESHLFQLPGFPFERKQIPQIVVIVRIQRKTMEALEQTTVPWAHGVGRSNRPAPTKSLLSPRELLDQLHRLARALGHYSMRSGDSFGRGDLVAGPFAD